MSVLLDESGKLFRPLTYAREADFEMDVSKLADQLFGSSSIYLDMKKRIGSNILTIPDGYLIDLTTPERPRLFVVENEIARHDSFRHIGIQMLRFVTGFEESQRSMRQFLMHEIRGRPVLAKLESACKASSIRNIDAYLDLAVYGPFKGLIVIDEAREDLHRVLSKIDADFSVLELRKYVSDSGSAMFQFDTLYDELDETFEDEIDEAPTRNPEERLVRRARRAASDTIVVPAREEGFLQVFLGQNQWHAIRIGAAMKERIRYIAAYQVAPISAVTHLAEVQDIKPYKDTGKYLLTFKGPAKEIRHVPLGDVKSKPQGPIYVKKNVLLTAQSLSEAIRDSHPS